MAYCGLDAVVERSGRAVISRGISKRGNKYLRSLFYFFGSEELFEESYFAEVL